MRKTVQKVYPITTLILLFFLFLPLQDGFGRLSVIWWRTECLLIEGFFFGPWLPIYGTGGILILVLLKRFFDRPGLLFVMDHDCLRCCGVCDRLVAGDVFSYPLVGLSGFCVSDSGKGLPDRVAGVWLGGLAFVYEIAPRLNKLIMKMNVSIRKLLCAVLITVFVIDLLYSLANPNTGFGITSGIWKKGLTNRQRAVMIRLV